jgi:hypothetical protein
LPIEKSSTLALALSDDQPGNMRGEENMLCVADGEWDAASVGSISSNSPTARAILQDSSAQPAGSPLGCRTSPKHRDDTDDPKQSLRKFAGPMLQEINRREQVVYPVLLIMKDL